MILNVDSESFTQGAVFGSASRVVADDANSDKYVFVYNGQSQKVERRKITESMLIGKDGVIVTDWLATRRTGCLSRSHSFGGWTTGKSINRLRDKQ